MENYQVMIKNIFKKSSNVRHNAGLVLSIFTLSPFTIMHCLFIQLATTPLLVLFLGSDDLSMVSASTGMK